MLQDMTFLKRFPVLETVHVRSLDPRIGVNLPSYMAVLGARCPACLMPRWAQDSV